MIQDLRNRTEKMQEMFTKDLEELKNKQTEMNNTLEGIYSRIMEAEERINDLKDRMAEITTAEQNTEKKRKKKKNEDSLRDLWDNIKAPTFALQWSQEEERRRQWHPTPVLLPGKSHGRRSLEGCSPWGHEESDTTERLPFHFSLSCIGERNGNPLQCSCLENPRDGGAWWAAIYGVAQSRT